MNWRALPLCALLSAVASSAAAQAPATPSAAAPPVLVAPRTLALPASVDTRERALERDLSLLGARGEGRVLSGVLQVVSGAALVTVGAILGDEIGRSLLILLGAGALAQGTTELALVPDAPAIANTYNHMPMLDGAQLRARIRFGEESLHKLARAGRRVRIIDGTVTMLVASGYVPLLWWLERRADPNYRFGDNAFDYVALAISGVSFCTGLVTALIRSEAERRERGYRELSEQLERADPGALERLARRTSLRLAVTREQLALSAHLRF